MPASLGLGLVFGVGLGPCSFAFLAPLLMIVFGQAQVDYWLAIGLLGAFALGHCGVIVLAGTAAQKAQTVVSWGSRSGVTRWVRRACGALVVLAGVYLVLK
jgi:cytochrome c-type biogenesis protein